MNFLDEKGSGPSEVRRGAFPGVRVGVKVDVCGRSGSFWDLGDVNYEEIILRLLIAGPEATFSL